MFDSWRAENTNKYGIVANFGTCYWWPSQSDPPTFTKTYDWSSLYQLIVEEYLSAAEKAYARKVGNYATTPLSPGRTCGFIDVFSREYVNFTAIDFEDIDPTMRTPSTISLGLAGWLSHVAVHDANALSQLCHNPSSLGSHIALRNLGSVPLFSHGRYLVSAGSTRLYVHDMIHCKISDKPQAPRIVTGKQIGRAHV